MRHADERQVGAGDEHERDEHGREPREAEERLAPERRRRPARRRSPARAGRRARATRPRCAPSRRARSPSTSPGRPRRGPRARARRASTSESDERRDEQRPPLEQPREVDERGDEGEAERHDDERLPEPRPLRDRGQVAVEVLRERQLQHVLAAQAEREDPDLDRRRSTPISEQGVQALRAPGRHSSSRRQTSRKPSEPISDGEREEVEPAHDVLGAGRPAGTVGLGRRRRLDADTERPDAGDDVPVGRENVPANRVGAPVGSFRNGADHVEAVRDRLPANCRPVALKTSIDGNWTNWSKRERAPRAARPGAPAGSPATRPSSDACAQATAGAASAQRRRTGRAAASSVRQALPAARGARRPARCRGRRRA